MNIYQVPLCREGVGNLVTQNCCCVINITVLRTSFQRRRHRVELDAAGPLRATVGPPEQQLA